MAASKKDPTEPIRMKASQYPEVDKGTACTQSSFKAGKQAFLFIGPQGGRFKAMFKLDKSRPEAIKLAEKDPDRFNVGSSVWITARFSAEEPMPKKLWEKWLDESYQLSLASTTKKKAAAKKKTAKKKTSAKKVVKKKSSAKKKKVVKAASVRKKATGKAKRKMA